MAAGTRPIHCRLAQIGLRVGGPYGFALAGGHAIAAHGILERPSEDVDLFADWQRRADFPTAVGEVIAAYRADGLEVQVDLRLDTFARLHVTDPDQPWPNNGAPGSNSSWASDPDRSAAAGTSSPESWTSRCCPP